jgi:hypothetical protein
MNAPDSFYYNKLFVQYYPFCTELNFNVIKKKTKIDTNNGYFFRKCSSKLGNIVSNSFFNSLIISISIFSLLINSSSNQKKLEMKREKKIYFYHHEKNKILLLNSYLLQVLDKI